MEYSLWRKLLLLILAALFQDARTNGEIGCLTDQSICREQEICVDDNYAGICVSIADDDEISDRTTLVAGQTSQTLADTTKESLFSCILSYATLVQRYHLEYDPEFCFNEDYAQNLRTLQHAVEFVKALRTASNNDQSPLDDFSQTEMVNEHPAMRIGQYASAGAREESEKPEELAKTIFEFSSDGGQMHVVLPAYVQPVDSENEDKNLLGHYYDVDSAEDGGQDGLVDKKDLEEIGIIDQGTGNQEHKIQTRLPELQAITVQPWYDYDGGQPQVALLQDKLRSPLLHWIENDRVYVRFNRSLTDTDTVDELLRFLSSTVGQHKNVTFDNVDVQRNEISFDVLNKETDTEESKVQTEQPKKVDAVSVAQETYNLMQKSPVWANQLTVTETGVSKQGTHYPVETKSYKTLIIPAFGISLLVLSSLAVVLIAYVYYARRKGMKPFPSFNASIGNKVVKDYEELCRQHVGGKIKIPQPLRGVVGTLAQRLGSQTSEPSPPPHSRSTNSSTSSWAEEPLQANMDVTTGHLILTYLDDHLKNTERLQKEWHDIETYKADQWSTAVALDAENDGKNRSNIVPYDHCRVLLSKADNKMGSDYVNASTICDHDPRSPLYVAAEAPTAYTAGNFWQMIWEQNCVVIVNLTKLFEHDEEKCYQYWPENKSQSYDNFEVHLVSEHIWCEDYLVRSFYLKNTKTMETRTVTQFHYLSWPENGLPVSAKSLLEFRRKVNKSYRAQGSPIVVHCSDGAERTGTYILVDMVLKRITKGVKEVDIAASLEHLRDQRMAMVRTIDQFQFALSCVAEEVQAIVKSASTG